MERSGGGLRSEYEAFCAREDVKAWLDPAATFDAIDSAVSSWWASIGGIAAGGAIDARTRSRRSSAKRHESIEVFKATQLLFHLQWIRLKKYANSKGISLVHGCPFDAGRARAPHRVRPRAFILAR